MYDKYEFRNHRLVVVADPDVTQEGGKFLKIKLHFLAQYYIKK